MDKKLIQKNLRKYEIATNSNMDGDKYLAEALNDFISDAPSTSSEKMEKERIKEYIKTLNIVYSPNLVIRKQHMHDLCRKLNSQRKDMDSETIVIIKVLFEEIEHIIMAEFGIEYNPKEQLQEIYQWAEDFYKYSEPEISKYDNQNATNAIYEFLPLLNKYLKRGYSEQNKDLLIELSEFLGILNLRIWQVATHIFGK